MSPTGDDGPEKKRLKIKINGPKKHAAHVEGDNVASRSNRRARGQAASAGKINKPRGTGPRSSLTRKAASPAPSSGLSSLASATSSSVADEDESREESPFQDVTETSAIEAYGEFASYYLTGVDEPDVETRPAKSAKTVKTEHAGTDRNRASTSGKDTPQADAPKRLGRPKKEPKSPSSRRSSAGGKATAAQHALSTNMPLAKPPFPGAASRAAHSLTSPQQQRRPSTNRAPSAVQHQGPMPFPQRPPPPPGHMQQPSGAPRQSQAPVPVIRFVEVPIDPKPEEPDTIAIMIDKLQSLSATLTQFGGVPAVAITPPRELQPTQKPAVKAKENVEQKVANKGDQVDTFLGLFDAEDEDSGNSEAAPTPLEIVKPQAKDFNHVLPNSGTADSPLVFGIQFIQNALKSWAQQRMTHQIMAQWNDEQARGCFLPQNGKGRGRPRKYDAGPGEPPPVIEMNLTDTPEGVAIRKFQLVLDSSCLQVNTLLPIELARALRLLYMQIDNLINQGRTDEKAGWYCMSYGAQLAAHRTRLNAFRETEARHQQEVALMHQQQHRQVMAQMGLNPQTTPMTQEEAQRHHAMELERRRSAQHAQQQPYISQQHLNPLQLGSNPQTPGANGASPSPALPQRASPRVSGNDSASHDGTAAEANGLPQRNHFEKVKMYMPNFHLPRSGQSMKFSFAPNSVEAIQAFGADAFPSRGSPPQQIPNRGPMMDVPRGHRAKSAVQTPRSDTAMPDAVRNPSASNTKEDAIDLTSSDGPQPEQERGSVERPVKSGGIVGGFVPINENTQPPTSPRGRSSSTSDHKSQDTIKVASHRKTAKIILKRRRAAIE